MSGATQRVGAVVRLELLTQRREPLTVLYMLVFCLLGAAFAAAGPVELVRERGPVPRDAAWSIMMAGTALVAFGQVITTMVAATVVLRDEADGLRDLLIASPLRTREYLLGKLIAALAMLCLIYTAIPVGLVAGALLGGGTLARAVTAAVPPFLIVTLPTMLAVGALQFAVGAMSGRLWVLVGQGLVLIWLWSACVDAAAVPHAGVIPALADPFGTAPLLIATSAWSDAQRAALPMPIAGSLIASRLLWLALGGAASLFAIVRTPRAPTHGATAIPDARAAARVEGADVQRPVTIRGGRTSWWRGIAAAVGFTAQWMLRDTGWRVLTALGAANVAVHVGLEASAGMSSPALSDVVLSAVQLHARLFLILLATIYAGELVWRERDDHSAAFFAAAPQRDAVMAAGRVLGVIVAQCVVVLAILAGATLVALVRAGALPEARVYSSAVSGVLLPFVSWMCVAAAVHVLLQQKVVAHLVCIAGWVLAVALWREVATGRGAALPWAATVGVAVGSAVIVWAAWVRGADGAGHRRWSAARRRVDF